MGGQPRASVETGLLSVAPRRPVLEVIVAPVARVVAAMAPVVTVGAGPRGVVDGGPWRAGVRWRRAVSGRCFRVWGLAAPGAAPGAPNPESSVGPWAGGWAGCEAGPRNGLAVGLPATGSPRGAAYQAERPGSSGPVGPCGRPSPGPCRQTTAQAARKDVGLSLCSSKAFLQRENGFVSGRGP